MARCGECDARSAAAANQHKQLRSRCASLAGRRFESAGAGSPARRARGSFHGTYSGGRMMNATSIESSKPLESFDGSSLAAVMSTGQLLRAYLIEARFECLRMFRVLGFSIPFLVLPAALYLLFGVVLFGETVRNDPATG